MKVRIHRGAVEIGGSCIEVESSGQRILLDVGMPLAASDVLQSLVRDDFYFDNTEEDLSVSVDMTELDDTAIAMATEHRGGEFF